MKKRTLTNRELAETMGIPIGKIRRNTKEFLGADPIATKRSGYKREFSINDGFFVYLGGWFVSELGLSFESARSVLQALKPWLLLNGLVPDIPEYAIRVGIDREMQFAVILNLLPKPWMIYGGHVFKFILEVSGSKGSRDYDTFRDSLGRPCQKIENETLSYHFGPSSDDERLTFTGGKKTIAGQDSIRSKPIYIMSMLYNFIRSILDEEKANEWRVNWKALAKKDPIEAEERIRKAIQENDNIYDSEGILRYLSNEVDI